ncbi:MULTISPECIES: histidine kinase [unclassified Bacillus (in: firmicutes)]|nr:histidine kinase [Bacillus sp. BP-3]MDC2865339.1 histidine kinase [Bacillus sp. BP-3]
MEKKPKVKKNWKMIAFAVVGGGAILFKIALKIGKLYAIHNWIDKMFS